MCGFALNAFCTLCFYGRKENDMRGRYTRTLNFLLPLGYFMIVLGFFLLYYKSHFKAPAPCLVLFLALQIMLGFVVQFFSIKKTHRIYQIFSGSLFFVFGMISLFLQIFKFLSFSKVWPFYAFFSGLIFLECSVCKHKKIRAEYGIPAVILMVMSLYYSLFSLEIIKFSLSFVSYFVTPVLIVGMAVLLVSFYFLQKKNKKLVLDDENSDEFSYEEYSEDDD